MKIALVHDYLREYGGAERVVEVFHELYPQAPLYTSFVDWKALGIHAEKFKNWDIRTTWVQKNWLVRKYHSPFRFLTPLIWESIDLREFDVVISSSGWFICRGVVVRPETLHISYIHHPPRNLYGYPTRLQNFFVQGYAALINPFLRMYDYSTAQRVDFFIANSQETRTRIKKFYRRDAQVIYPPIEIPEINSHGLTLKNKSDYYLSVGRLMYVKRVDLVIAACNKLKLPLKVVGTGKDQNYLKSIAGETIEFLGEVPDDKLDKLYREAKALIFCALQEDFGMVAVEAMAHGTPVIGFNQGGIRETVIDGKTGVLFDEPNLESLISAINRFEKIKADSFSENCYVFAQQFSKEKFLKKIKNFVEEKYQKHLSNIEGNGKKAKVATK